MMTKRIEELYKQSFIEVQDENSFPCMTFSKQKFAELIVRECISVVDSLASPDDNDDYFWTVQNTSSKLKEHFGVE